MNKVMAWVAIVTTVFLVTVLNEMAGERLKQRTELVNSAEYQVGDVCGMYIVGGVYASSSIYTVLRNVRTGERTSFDSEAAVKGFCEHEFNSPRYTNLLKALENDK